MASPSAVLRLGGRSYPVVVPSWRDPRLHSAAIILSLQVLGQTVLGFDLSVAQILSCLVTCALLEVVITYRQQGIIMWPASAMLTGNSVAFILRIPGTTHGDWWSLRGDELFLFASVVSLASKYVIRIGGRHIFNPSNVGLVLTFMLFGSQRVNPQDLWWGPFSPGLVLTLAIIVAGGLFVVWELRMLAMIAAFWVSLAAFIGLIALQGHCISARWHYGPVCGSSFWILLVSSPEILVFVFFMMTDPKTAPRASLARLAYGIGLGFVAAVLIAPFNTEFATKVALLAGLVVVCAAQPLLAWVSRQSAPRQFRHPRPLVAIVTGGVALAVGVGSALGAASLAPGVAAAAPGQGVAASLLQRRPAVPMAASMIPVTVVAAATFRFDPKLDHATAQRMVRDVIDDLLIEADAIKRLDRGLAATAAVDPLLGTIQTRIALATAAGQAVVPSYAFDQATIILIYDPNASQAPPTFGVRLSGHAHYVMYSTAPSRDVVSETDAAYDHTLGLQQVGSTYLLATDRTTHP